MAISEELQRRIDNLTGATKGAISNKEMQMNVMDMVGDTKGAISNQDMNMMMANQAARQGISAPEQRAAMIKKTAMDMGKMISDEDANAFGVGSMSFEDAMSKAFVMDMVGRTKGAISNKEMEMFEEAFTSEDQETLDRLLKQEAALESAPLGPLAQELRAQGMEEDTELAHVRLGEVILPPEFLDDDEFGTAVEKKFEEAGINPETAVVGGIGTLNPSTGLQQFFLKKIAKGLKKVVKKVAPIAAFIPGVGTALGGVLGGIGGLATKIPGIGGALGKIGSTVAGGIANLGIPGISSIAGGTAGGFGGIGKALTTKAGLLGGGMFGQTGSMYAGGPEAGKGLANRLGLGSGTAAQVQQFQQAQQAQAALNALTPDQLANMDPAQLQQLRAMAAGGGGTGIGSNISSIFGGGGGGAGIGGLGGGGGGGGFLSGLGNFAKVAGIGALATGLGKLAYEDAKKQKGVALTPMVTMSPTGRYNIEAEIARRMGQARPNPVEFGLLPEGTLPVLSGGQPRQAAYGGAIEELQGGMVRGMKEGGLTGLSQKIGEGVDNYAIAPYLAEIGFFEDPSFEKYVEGARLYNQNTKNPAILKSVAPFMDDSFKALQEGYKAFLETFKEKRSGMARGMMRGGIMAFAQGGAVAMQEGGEMDPGSFPRMDGDINGPGTEQSDDIPAMLSDGEFVMTARAVRGAGSYEMKTEPGGIINLVPSLEEDRERGMDVMYKVMDTFSGQAQPS